VVWSVWKVLVWVRVGELVLDDVGAGVDQARVRDHTEFLHFARLK